MKSFVVLGIAGLLGACSATYPTRNLSAQNRIDEALKQAATPPQPAASVPLPPAVSQSLLPPLRNTLPRAVPTEPRFDLVLIDAPIGQVLHAIVDCLADWAPRRLIDFMARNVRSAKGSDQQCRRDSLGGKRNDRPQLRRRH